MTFYAWPQDGAVNCVQSDFFGLRVLCHDVPWRRGAARRLSAWRDGSPRPQNRCDRDLETVTSSLDICRCDIQKEDEEEEEEVDACPENGISSARQRSDVDCREHSNRTMSTFY
ncbi:hypothetical protein J6590_020508 [Homalodisca vitripennis]|nr:hypothetical protein J6590_020508 [Homalodisca vitripennis]